MVNIAAQALHGPQSGQPERWTVVQRKRIQSKQGQRKYDWLKQVQRKQGSARSGLRKVSGGISNKRL